MSRINNPIKLRRNLNINNFKINNNGKEEKVNKSRVLSFFIGSVQNSEANADDYLHYLCSLNFKELNKPFSEIKSNGEFASEKLTPHQKQAMEYLCANESCLFNQAVTRGQMKLWFVLYNLKYSKPPRDFNTLCKWINSVVFFHVKKPSEGYDFIHYFQQSQEYFNTIHLENAQVVMGKGEYKNSRYIIKELKSKIAPLIYNSPREASVTIGSQKISALRVELESRPPVISPEDFVNVPITPEEALKITVTPSATLEKIVPEVIPIPEFPPLIERVARISRRVTDEPLNRRENRTSKSRIDYSCPIQWIDSNKFLREERAYFEGNKEHVNFSLGKDTIRIIRSILSNKIANLVYLKEFQQPRLTISNLIIQFMVDNITRLKDILKIYTPDYIENPFNKANPTISELMEFFRQKLHLIVNEESMKPLLNVLRSCLEKNYISINSKFEIFFPRHDLFADKTFDHTKCLTREEDRELDVLLFGYSEYCVIPGAFSGHPELAILQHLDKFRYIGEKIGNTVRAQYDASTAHVGGKLIKADGNCVLSLFMYEYLKIEKT